MVLQVAVFAVLALSVAAFFLGYRHAWAIGGGSRKPLHSLPTYHGVYTALWTLLPPLLVLGIFLAAEQRVIDWIVLGSLPDEMVERAGQPVALMLSTIRTIAAGNEVVGQPSEAQRAAADLLSRLDYWGDRVAVGVVGLIAVGGLTLSYRRLRPDFRARNGVEAIVTGLLIACSVVAVLTTVGIVMSVLFEAIRFFSRVSPIEFFFGTEWQASTSIREGQIAGGEGEFGIIPLFVGTLLIASVAMSVAVPIGLLAAIYLSEFASKRIRAVAKPMLEILAGIPTVVYGFFAAIIVAPFLSNLGDRVGLDIGTQSALAAGSVMGIMIIPFVSSLSDDVIHAIPQKLRDGAMSLGATHGETIRRVVLPAATPGIVGAIILAVSRAIGETMIVLMAAGLFANLTFNPLESVTTVTVQIATLLTGDQQFDSAKTLSAFALGLVLFVITLGLNVIALKITQHYREKYD
jgi:phosphate transport system permease protein